MVFAMSVDYFLTYPMIDRSPKVADKVASYYRCTRGSSSGQLFTGSWVATAQLILCIPCKD